MKFNTIVFFFASLICISCKVKPPQSSGAINNRSEVQAEETTEQPKIIDAELRAGDDGKNSDVQAVELRPVK